jgi:hypothetical protein
VKPVKIAWNKFTHTRVTTDLNTVLDENQLSEFVRKAEGAKHPAYQLGDDLFVEIPAADWRHGDLLIYLPSRGWLVRRNYRAHWYVDMGIFRKATDEVYGWTDLWLDVIAPERAENYHLLDADEFASALGAQQVSVELAAYALRNLHALTEIMHDGGFPIREVRTAQQFVRNLG